MTSKHKRMHMKSEYSKLFMVTQMLKQPKSTKQENSRYFQDNLYKGNARAWRLFLVILKEVH